MKVPSRIKDPLCGHYLMMYMKRKRQEELILSKLCRLCARVGTYSNDAFKVAGVAHDVIHEWLTLSTPTARPLPRALAHSCAD